MGAFAKAWETLKALPEQQQFTDLPALGEGFERQVPAAQHRVGTVHPSIIGMLQRHQNAEMPGYSTIPKMFTEPSLENNPRLLLPHRAKPAVLRTTGTSESNPAGRGMIQAHIGRTGMPSRDHELYSGEYGQSPQFVTSMPSYRGVPDYEGRISVGGDTVQGRLESQVPYPRASGIQTPKGSQQAMIDELYRKDPDAAARMFGTQHSESDVPFLQSPFHY